MQISFGHKFLFKISVQYGNIKTTLIWQTSFQNPILRVPNRERKKNGEKVLQKLHNFSFQLTPIPPRIV